MANRKDIVFEIKTEKLKLDNYNPRLYGESATESQEQIMDKIYQKESIDELASSLSVNGYFKEEPIIVIPENEADFNLINETNFNDFTYIVIEGNRRTTSVKLLLKDYGIVDPTFPKITDPSVTQNLQQIPSIIYEKREDVDVYLSVRHISGHRKWDAFAKAKYIFDKVNKLNEQYNDLQRSINALSTQIGDKNMAVKKYYIYYKIFEEIEESIIDYSSRNIKDRFSLLEVSLAAGNTTIAQYIGLPPFKNISFDEPIIKPEKEENLRDLTEWVFGKDEKGTGSIISDSRQIGQFLKRILGNPEAAKHLKEYRDLEGAFDLTSGEQEMVLGSVRKASKLLYNIIGKIKKYKDDEDLKDVIKDLEENLDSINTFMKSSEQ